MDVRGRRHHVGAADTSLRASPSMKRSWRLSTLFGPTPIARSVSLKLSKVDKLGVIAGAGALPRQIVAACQESGREFCVLLRRQCRLRDDRGC